MEPQLIRTDACDGFEVRWGITPENRHILLMTVTRSGVVVGMPSGFAIGSRARVSNPAPAQYSSRRDMEVELSGTGGVRCWSPTWFGRVLRYYLAPN